MLPRRAASPDALSSTASLSTTGKYSHPNGQHPPHPAGTSHRTAPTTRGQVSPEASGFRNRTTAMMTHTRVRSVPSAERQTGALRGTHGTVWTRALRQGRPAARRDRGESSPIQRDRDLAGDPGYRPCRPCCAAAIALGPAGSGSRVWQKTAGTTFDDLAAA